MPAGEPSAQNLWVGRDSSDRAAPHPSWAQLGGMSASAAVSDVKRGLWLCSSLWKWPLSLAEFLEACSSWCLFLVLLTPP